MRAIKKRLGSSASLLILCLSVQIGKGQTEIVPPGKYSVSKVKLKGGEAAGLSETNCTWCGHYKTNVPLEVDGKGNVRYRFEDQPQSARFTIVERQLKVNFYNSPTMAEGMEEYTMYDYKATGTGFVIKRSDPRVTEEYEFKKLN